jgi:hypothetical protein
MKGVVIKKEKVLAESGLLFWVDKLEPEYRTGIIETIILYFSPKLNQNLLFQSGENAPLFSRVVNEIAVLKPEYEFIEPGFNFFPNFYI